MILLVACRSGVAPPPQTPTPTPARPPILDAWPLRQGAAWVYSVTLDYAQGTGVTHWTGAITETITSAMQQDSGWVFDFQIEGHPLRTDEQGNQQGQYVALGNRLYKWFGHQETSRLIAQQGQGFEDNQVLVVPLASGQVWGAPQHLVRGDGLYFWHVQGQEDLATPAGKFAGCYELALRTNPDHINVWFCPGIGIVRQEYHHHGSVMDELDVLQKYVSGK